MHAYREFVQREADARGWTQAELSRKSGLSTAVISRLLGDSRERLVQLPDDTTIESLARAFGGVDIERRLWLSVARAMRLPVDAEVRVADAAQLTDDELMRELASRLQRSERPAVNKIAELSDRRSTVTAEDLRGLKSAASPIREDQTEGDGDSGDSP